MSLAADARDAVRERPFLLEALRAGVVNYSAAARALAVSDDEEAVATALRRFAEQLPAPEVDARRATVTMHSGIGPTDDGPALLSVNGHGLGPGDAGDRTAVVATGAVDHAALGHALGRLGAAGVAPVAAGVVGRALCVVVDRSDGPRAVRVVEDALEAVPDPTV